MSRYIDADKLVERLKFKRDTDNIDRNKYAGLECAIAQCNKAPTADVVEVRHGEWLHAGMFDDMAKCSVCGLIDHSLNEVYSRGTYNYCPNCGAKMDGERRDDAT